MRERIASFVIKDLLVLGLILFSLIFIMVNTKEKGCVINNETSMDCMQNFTCTFVVLIYQSEIWSLCCLDLLIKGILLNAAVTLQFSYSINCQKHQND